MSALGKLLGMAYANKYGGKYELPSSFGSNEDEQSQDESPFDVGATQGMPLQVSPSPVSTPQIQPSQPSWIDNAVFNIVNTIDKPMQAEIATARAVENWGLANPDNSFANFVRPIASFAKGNMQGLSGSIGSQALLNGYNVVSNIFHDQPVVLPKLAGREDQVTGFDSAAGLGSLAGNLEGMALSLLIGGVGGAAIASKVPALASALSDVPLVGKAIGWAENIPFLGKAVQATGLGSSSVGQALGTGVANSVLSGLNDSRDIVEGKKSLGSAAADAAIALPAGALFAGTANPEFSVLNRALGEAGVNTASGMVQESRGLLTGETTPEQYATNAALQGGAGFLLPLLGHGVSKGSKAVDRIINGTSKINASDIPVDTQAPPSVSEATVEQAAATQGTQSEATAAQAELVRQNQVKQQVQDFVKKHFKDRVSREDLGMGKSSQEIANNLHAEIERNPEVGKTINDIQAGTASKEDLINAIKNPSVVKENLTTEMPKPVVAENTAPEQTISNLSDFTPEDIGKMRHEDLAQHFPDAVHPLTDQVPEAGKVVEGNVQEPHIANESIENIEQLPTGANNAQVHVVDGITYERPKPFVSFDEKGAAVPEAPNVIIGNPTEVTFNETSEPAHYIVHPSDYSVPSHRNGIKNPNNFLGNPQAKEGQATREYVEGILKRWNPENMMGTDKNAFQNAPKTILPNGEPIQGNTRAELEQRIYENPNDPKAAQLKQYIIKNADKYGFDTPEKIAVIEAMPNPTVSRVVNPTPERANELLNIHQDDAAFQKTPTDRSNLRLAKISKDQEKRAFSYLEDRLNEPENKGKSFMQLLDKDEVRQDVSTILSNGEQRTMRIYSDDLDTGNGKNAIEMDLRNMVLGRDEESIKKFNQLKSSHQEVINANLGNIFRLGDDPLAKDFKEAVKGLFEYNRFKGQKKDVTSWLTQIDANNHVNEDNYSKGAVELMKIMDKDSPATVKNIISEYANARANDVGSGFFGGEPMKYEDFLSGARRKIKKQEGGINLNSYATPVVAAAVQALSESVIDDNDTYFGMNGADLKKGIRILTTAAAMTSVAGKLLRSLKVSLPETETRILRRIDETTIPGYEDKKFKPSDVKKEDVDNLVGKARADGITDELLAHHLAFMHGESNNPRFVDKVQSELLGHTPNAQSEYYAADFLLKNTLQAHNRGRELPPMSDRLHNLILNTVDELGSAPEHPEIQHVQNLIQGRELSLGDRPVETLQEDMRRANDIGANWQNDLYAMAAGDDPVLKQTLEKLKNHELLSDEEVQAYKKHTAEKKVWNDTTASAVETDNWDDIIKMSDSIENPVRKEAFQKFISTKIDDIGMNKEVSSIANEEGIPVPEPVRGYKPTSQALYSMIIPVAPGEFKTFNNLWKNKYFWHHAGATAFSYAVADLWLFPDDNKQYLGMSAVEARSLFAATIGNLLVAPHLRRYILSKLLPGEWAKRYNDLLHKETILSLDIKNVVAADSRWKGKEGTPEFNAEIARREQQAKDIDKGMPKGSTWFNSLDAAAAKGNPIADDLINIKNKADISGRTQKQIMDDLGHDYHSISPEARERAQYAAFAYDKELGLIRAKDIEPDVKELERLTKIDELNRRFFDGHPDAKIAFDKFQELRAHASQIDIESFLMKRFGISWKDLPDKIDSTKLFIGETATKLEGLINDFANAKIPSEKKALREQIAQTKNLKKDMESFVDQATYLQSLPELSTKYHYLPHFYDKPGKFKFAVYDKEGKLAEFHKFETKRQAETWLTKFTREGNEGLHPYKDVKRVGDMLGRKTTTGANRNLDVNDIMSLAYSVQTANYAKLGISKEEILKSLDNLPGWEDLSAADQMKLADSIEHNVSPASLRKVIEELYSPSIINLEKRNNIGGYSSVDYNKYLTGSHTPKESAEAKKWVLGAVDHMATTGRIKLEKAALLRAAQEYSENLAKQGMAGTETYKWLNGNIIEALTSSKGLTPRQLRVAAKTRSVLAQSVLALNPKHGAWNFAAGSISSLSEGAWETNPFKSAGNLLMTTAWDLPTGGKWRDPKIQQVAKLLDSYASGETQWHNQMLSEEFPLKKTREALMAASVKSEQFNNQISSLVGAKIALQKGASIEEAAEFGLKFRQRTQYAFTPWMTTRAERWVRNQGGGLGSIAMTLMGASLRAAEHEMSFYYRALDNPKKGVPAALTHLLATTFFAGLAGSMIAGSAIKAVNFIKSLGDNKDDTRLTKENDEEYWQRKTGEYAEKVGIDKQKAEAMHKRIMQGVVAETTNVNFAQNNDIIGLLHPLMLSEGAGLLNAAKAIVSDKSATDKLLTLAKTSTIVNRVARAGSQLSQGHFMDSDGDIISNKKYTPADAAKEVFGGRPADQSYAARMKGSGGGDLYDEMSKVKYVNSLYDLPGLTVGNEKSQARKQDLIDQAPEVRRRLQKEYETTSKLRADDLKQVLSWADKNKPLLNWIDRNGGAEVAGNLPAPSRKALETNIEKYYTAKSAANVIPSAKFTERLPAPELVIRELEVSAAKKAKTRTQKIELRSLLQSLER